MMYCNFQGSPHPAWPRNMGRLHLRLGQSPHLAAVTRSRLVRCRISGMPQQKPQSQGFCGSPQKLSQEGSEGYLPQMCVVNTKYPRRYSLNGVTRRAASPWSKYSNQWDIALNLGLCLSGYIGWISIFLWAPHPKGLRHLRTIPN